MLTAPTTAQNRAGSRMKDDETGRGMEFFDPKTRPAAIFWDEDALLTAPVQLIRTGAASVYARAVMNLGGIDSQPAGRRRPAAGVPACSQGRCRASPIPPIPGRAYELCAATLLQNRENDDGGAQFERLWAVRVAYALSTALISICAHVGQGEAYSALMGTVTRRLGDRDPEAMARIAQALGVWEAALRPSRRRSAWRDKLEATFRSIGMPTRLSELNIDRAAFPRLVEHSLTNFNADPKREFVRESGTLKEILEAAW